MTHNRTAYTPSHERRYRKQVHHLEYENADLRNRLAALTREVEYAKGILHDIETWQAYVHQPALEFARRAQVYVEKARAPAFPALEAEKRAIKEGQLKSGRATLYVGDRRYNRHDTQ